MKIEGIARAGFLGLWEVRIATPEGTRILYTNDDATHFFIGAVFEAKTQTDLTEQRMRRLNTVRFADLPLNQAFKIVRGKGTRQFAYFSDPRCPYCQRFDQELVEDGRRDGARLHAPDHFSRIRAARARGVVLARPGKAWLDLTLNNVTPTAPKANCPNPIEKNLELGKKFRVNGTPTLILADGQRMSG